MPMLVRMAMGLLAGATTAWARARVGMMYEGWHAPAYWGRSLAHNLTVEDVVRSNGSLSMANMSAGMDHAKGMGFYYHKQPADGFYCIYRKRSTENVSSCGLPDCPGITATLTRHAAMLTSVGMDFIVADSTNIQNTGATADALQLRPWEVLGEEWLKLRSQGVTTPSIAIWQNLQEPTGNLWEEYVNGAYSDPAYDDMIFKDAHTGRKVLFATANPTPAIVKRIEASGKIVVVTMWAERMNFDKGEWAFFSPCTTAAGQFSSSVYSSEKHPCNQHATKNSVIGPHGTSLTVGPSYQLSYASLPFRASGKLGGLTLKKQFEKAFALNALGSLDYLQVGTFNEHIAQPQPNNYKNYAVDSMGLEGDSFATKLWVDMYGDSITRDLEPTVQDGGRMWALFESCMRVFNAGHAFCTNASEPCCMRGESDPASSWRNVWSLRLAEPEDHLLTVDENERATLLKGKWQEVCSPAGGASAFCAWGGNVNGMAPNASAYHSGPFLLHGSPADTYSACHRCTTTKGGRHFVSLDATCRGLGTSESILGYTAQTRSTDVPRSLRLCASHSGALYHSLDSVCDEEDHMLEHLGFVH